MTRIEMLTVGTIIGIVGLASAFAISTARTQTRDITRLAHVREIQIGLELYFNDHATYPTVSEATPLGQTTTACLSGDGFGPPCAVGDAKTAYVEFVPAPPSRGLRGRSSCDDDADAYCYQGNGGAFAIQFELERKNNLLGVVKGANCATADGLKPGVCPALVVEQSPEQP
jgi:hypothetical protein